MTAILVVELSGNNRTAVLPLQALNLCKDLAVEFLSQTEKHTIGLTDAATLGKDPVGDAAIAHLAMTERAKTQDDGYVFRFADFQKSA